MRPLLDQNPPRSGPPSPGLVYSASPPPSSSGWPGGCRTLVHLIKDFMECVFINLDIDALQRRVDLSSLGQLFSTRPVAISRKCVVKYRLLLLAPVQLLPHDLHDARERFVRPPARSGSRGVFSERSHRPPLPGDLSHLGHIEGFPSVRRRQCQTHRFAGRGGEAVCFDGCVQSLLSHRSVVADLPQDEVDVVLPRDGVSRHAGGGVGRPSYGHLLPGQEEDDASVTGRWIQKTHVVRTVGGEQVPVVAGDDDVHSGARLADVLSFLVVHLPQRVCERPPGPAHLLLPALGVFGLQQVHHLSVVGDGGPVAYRRQRDGQTMAPTSLSFFSMGKCSKALALLRT
ncbi:hypothetical protein F7725_009329 [Dissostichus mawsoni]|uniref:Uncharacterized protein n=1 Tax=Dissostichus mawsoni TaxID=36200 RepID=A0A7J5Z798_DISMA|nr:hypothetical protein F7725_009329 [Dissostichus mawsoni]